MDSRILLQALLNRRLVTVTEVEQALSTPGHRGKALEQVLVEEGILEEAVLLDLMSELYGLPLVSLTPETVDMELGSRLPQRLLQEYCVYPLQSESKETVILATVEPFDVVCEDTFRQLTGRRTEFVLAPRSQIENAISGKLVSGEGLRLLVEAVPESDWEGLDAVLGAEGELSENAAPIVKLVNSILRDAINKEASDIHIEPQEASFRVRFRIDGILRQVVEMPKRVEKTCISRLKIMSGIDISESRKAQDGRISVRTATGRVNMRVSTIPGYHGEKVVLRLLDQSSVQLELPALGLSPSALEVLSSHIASSSGMVLITGPTGSGKTSTLYAALRRLNTLEVNIVTVEDPIEYQVPGLTQVGVNVRAGVTFATALRAFLRQDPDIIMVGEVRDLETAETAIQAAQTGHLVFSTLHTNDAPGTLSRLVLMGVESHALADSLLCVVAQRLVRKICKHCRVPVEPKPEHLFLLHLAVECPAVPATFRGAGCERCDGTGYRGRTGLYEILTVTSTIRKQMLIDVSEEALWQTARAEGMQTLLEDGLAKVESGCTSLDEVLRVVTLRRKPAETAETAETAAAPAPLAPPLVIGRGLLKTVRDVMSHPVVTVLPESTLAEVARLSAQKAITGFPVVTIKGKVLGVVSLSDLVAAELLPEHARQAQTVREVMSERTISVGPDEPLGNAMQLLWRHKIHRLLVIDNDHLVGILTPFDLMLSNS